MMNQSRRALVRRWLLVLAGVVLFCVPFFRSYEERDRTPTLEEFYWVGQTYYYHLAVEQGDWTNPDWQLIPARENPQLGRCIIGLGLQLDGLSVTNLDWLGYYYHIIFKGWGEGRERDQRQAVVDRMQPAVRDMVVNHDSFEYPVACITAGRAVMLVFGIISIMLVFILTSLYAGEGIGFLAALAFALHPAVVTAYTHLGVDILAIAFSLLTVLHFEWIKRRVWQSGSRPRLYRALICVTGGLSLAFAIGSKLNALVVGFLGAALCLLYLVSYLWRRDPQARDTWQAMLFLLLISFFFFVASNPLSYPHPISALWSIYTTPQRIMEIQRQVLPGALNGLGERFSSVASIVAFSPALFALVVGAFLLEIIQNWKAGEPWSIPALWWLLAFVVVTAWLPFARPLHVLPVIAASVVLTGSAIGRLIQIGRARSATREKTAQAPRQT